MITLEYCKEGSPISDFEMGWYEGVLIPMQNKPFELSISTSNLFELVLTLVAEGKLDHKNVKFIYNGESFSPTFYGTLPNWPKGFCDCYGDLVERRLIAQTKLYKEKKSG